MFRICLGRLNNAHIYQYDLAIGCRDWPWPLCLNSGLRRRIQDYVLLVYL